MPIKARTQSINLGYDVRVEVGTDPEEQGHWYYVGAVARTPLSEHPVSYGFNPDDDSLVCSISCLNASVLKLGPQESEYLDNEVKKVIRNSI